MNNRLCVQRSESEDGSNSYLPGYAINYSLSESSGSLREKSSGIAPKKNLDNSSKSLILTDYQTVADRCRVAIEGRGDYVSIEGHGMSKNKKR